MQIVAQRGVQRVLKNVRELSGDFGETRKAVAGGRAAECMGGDVETFQIFAARLNFLEDAHVFAEVLEVLGSLLEE